MAIEEVKSPVNRDVVRLALIDGPKTVGGILSWARARNYQNLDMPLCNLILPRLQKEGEVRWTGSAWQADEGMQPVEVTELAVPPAPVQEATPKPVLSSHPPSVPTEPTAPEPKSAGRTSYDWSQEFEVIRTWLAKEPREDSITFKCPSSISASDYARKFRQNLLMHREMKGHRWSVGRSKFDDSLVIVMEMGEKGKPKVARQPTVKVHVAEPREVPTTQTFLPQSYLPAICGSVLIMGLFNRLPPPDSVWPTPDREAWLLAVKHVLALEYRESNP